MRHLQDMGELGKLVLSHNPITDMGLARLQGLFQLHTLNLAQTKVTDAGLEQLKQFTRLRTLHVRGPRITPKGVDKLREYLPDLVVRRDTPLWVGVPLTRAAPAARMTATTHPLTVSRGAMPKPPPKPLPTGSSPPKEHLQR